MMIIKNFYSDMVKISTIKVLGVFPEVSATTPLEYTVRKLKLNKEYMCGMSKRNHGQTKTTDAP